jgi:hypothetical protein
VVKFGRKRLADPPLDRVDELLAAQTDIVAKRFLDAGPVPEIGAARRRNRI